MRGDAVEKPAVMADDHGAAGEVNQRLRILPAVSLKIIVQC